MSRMSRTMTSLAVSVMSQALERLETLFDEQAEMLSHRIGQWKEPDLPIEQLDYDASMALEELRSIAVTKRLLVQLIRTRPEKLPPEPRDSSATGVWPWLMNDALCALGDAETADELSHAVRSLRNNLVNTMWDVDGPPVADQKSAAEPDELGSTNDLGEVTPGPAEDR